MKVRIAWSAVTDELAAKSFLDIVRARWPGVVTVSGGVRRTLDLDLGEHGNAEEIGEVLEELATKLPGRHRELSGTLLDQSGRRFVIADGRIS